MLKSRAFDEREHPVPLAVGGSDGAVKARSGAVNAHVRKPMIFTTETSIHACRYPC